MGVTNLTSSTVSYFFSVNNTPSLYIIALQIIEIGYYLETSVTILRHCDHDRFAGMNNNIISEGYHVL